MQNSNWPLGVDRGHPNWTLKIPRVSSGGHFVEPENKRCSIFWWLMIAAVIVGFVVML